MTPNLEMSLDDPVSTVWRIVGLPVRLTLTQSREVRGRFECVDHLHNVILSDAEEHTMVHRDDGKVDVEVRRVGYTLISGSSIQRWYVWRDAFRIRVE
mmetsp:Transcript_4677/g.9439  ORF Transcript_4677/g.9439 Transcript_4677/m.9439 type:complete len:98 (+) Transcript_4677:2208-2501(+)